MLDPASSTPHLLGFPVELRPLLVLVIVLAILHMVLRSRVKRGAPERRRSAERRSVQHACEAAPMKGDLPPEPADALLALRQRADEGTQRP